MLQATTEARPLEAPSGGLMAALEGLSPVRAAVGTFLVLLGTVLGLVLARTGGFLVYSLDDPYIHIAVAERLLRGIYGINAGEVTSPSSSVIWPFLLAPAAWTPLGLHAPLILNALIGLGTAWCLGVFAGGLDLPRDFRHAHATRVALAMLLVVSTNLVGLAFTGLEHNLQVFIAVALALALVDYARGRALPGWALWLAALGPSVRYEMLAVTAAVCLVLLYERSWRRLLAVALGSLVLPAGLAVFLVANGNYPLPNSVMTKLGAGGAIGTSGLLKTFHAGGAALREYFEHGLDAKLAMVGSIAVAAWGIFRSSGRMRVVLCAGVLVGVSHMLLGQFGWFFRYEVYALAFCGMIAIGVLAPRVPLAALLMLLATAIVYAPALILTPAGAANIYEQQYQMHRLVSDHYRKSFAVNDLGWVSIGLDPGIYVLDLWGLASNEAVRRHDKSPEWMDEITRRHNVGLAMIYKGSFRGIPASWAKAGELRLASPRVTAAEDTVQIYATAVGDKAEIVRRLHELKPRLPAGVALEIE